MKKTLKALIIFTAIAAVAGITYMLLPFFPQSVTKSFDGKEIMHIGTTEKLTFKSIIEQAQEKLSGIYWVYGIENPFDGNGEINIADFYADIRKDEQGYSIQEILMDVQYLEGQFLYTQQIHIRPDSVYSGISRHTREGLVISQDGPSLQTLVDKLDRLEFKNIPALLPKCDGYMLDVMQSGDVMARSTPEGVTRYLACDDGSLVKSGEDTDTPIGAVVPVITMFAANVNGNTYGGDTAIQLFLNN